MIRSRVSRTTLCIACLLATLASVMTLSILFAAPQAQAQGMNEDLVTIRKNGTSKAKSSSEAAREIQAAMTAEAAREQAIDMIGEKRYQKNRSAVENRIVKQSSKFVPFVNPGTPVQVADGSWKMDVELKISPTSLRRLVLDAGLLSDSDGPASILPIVAFTDRSKGVSVRWWQGEPKDDAHKMLSGISRIFYDKAQASFSKEGFHIIKPQGSQISPLPEAYRAEQPSAADLGFIADYFKSQMVLKGEVRLKESRNTPGATFCALKLQVIQPSSGRSIAEVSRQFVTDVGPTETVVRNKLSAEFPEVAKDLAAQVLEAWQRGTLNTSLMRLTVRGRLGPKQVSEIKAGLAQNVHEFKAVKERFFDTGQIVFEVDYTGQVPQLTDRLRSLKLAGYETKVADSSAQNLTLDVKPR